MRNFYEDIENIKMLCDTYQINFNYNNIIEINDFPYTIIYDTVDEDLLRFYLLKTIDIYNITDDKIIIFYPVDIQNNKLNLYELLYKELKKISII